MTKLEQWAVELFRRAVEAYGGESIPGETECYAARVIQSAFEDRERKLREALASIERETVGVVPEVLNLQMCIHTVNDVARQALKETPDADQ